MKTTEPTTPLASLHEALDKASKELHDATAGLRRAQARHTDAINAVNEAQRAFDEGVTEVRRSAISGTDWHGTYGLGRDSA